ncbi:hypothetical protein BHE74_00018563 [Ensete ventricosum]|nr:hypothetical protein BHE74_00018563 [Ensete ventricosum]
MIAPTEEPKLKDTAPEPKEKDTPQPTTRTVPTLVGYTNLQKLKIEGFLEQQSVIILIVTGSTHNFMSSKKIRDMRVAQEMVETDCSAMFIFATTHLYILFLRDKLLLKCYILLNSL